MKVRSRSIFISAIFVDVGSCDKLHQGESAKCVTQSNEAGDSVKLYIRPKPMITVGIVLMSLPFAGFFAVQERMGTFKATYNWIGSCLFLLGVVIVLVGCGLLASRSPLPFTVLAGFSLAATGSLVALVVDSEGWTATLFIPALTVIMDGILMLIIGLLRLSTNPPRRHGD